MMGIISLIYELHGLTDEESLAIFVKWAFKDGEEKNYPNLVEIGKEIVSKCKRVPMTMRTLASSLFLNFNEEKWKSVRNNEIWDVPQKENDIVPILKLSYDRISFYLRQCFSFFSLYPKDFEFDNIDVTELWLAFGLLQPSNESLKLEDVATQYLHELHSRCFLQDFMCFGYFYSFKMHNLAHDLAVFVTKDEFLMVNSHTKIIHENCRHLSIVKNDSGQGKIKENRLLTFYRKSTKFRETYDVIENSHILDCFPESKRVKSIIFPVEGVGLGMDNQVLNKWLSRYKYLWVLDLSDSCLKTLPKSIEKLRCLRHLNLSFNRYLEKLPNSICELQGLQTLLLKRCGSLRALPKGLRKLISLRQLAVTTMQSDLSETDISSLTSLQILSFDSCWHLKSLLRGIQLLTSLRELSIHGCTAINSFNFDSITHLPELVALSITYCPFMEFSEGHDNLETTRMKLRFVRFGGLLNLVRLPEWLQGAADTLHTLIIEGCWNLEALPDWLSTFSQLNTLQIHSCIRLLSLPKNMKGFTALECLEIVGCHRALERKYRYEVGEYWPNISHLKSITIKGSFDDI